MVDEIDPLQEMKKLKQMPTHLEITTDEGSVVCDEVLPLESCSQRITEVVGKDPSHHHVKLTRQ